MHIEPGIIDGAKMALSYATGAGALAFAGKLALTQGRERGLPALIVATAATTALTFAFFEILPHHAVGVSEVHFIMGSTLFLLFGAGPAALGLALGLLAQGLMFAPADLPQYAVNVTTLLVPLFAVSAVATRIVAPSTRYVDLTYAQAVKLSVTYQGGVVAWVAFWAFYGQGFSAEAMSGVGLFGAAYMTVVLIEPLVDLAALALAKALRNGGAVETAVESVLERRLWQAA